MTDTSMSQTFPDPSAPHPEHKKILGNIWRMGYPSMIGFAATNLYTLADMFWVSRLGADRVAALTIFAAFYWVIGSANQVAGVGSVAIIARRYGEKDMEKTKAAILDAFALKFILAAIFGTIGYLLTPTVVVMLGATGDIVTQAVTYGRIMLIALFFSFPTWTAFTALRGIGQPRYAMMLMIGSTVFNATLDPLLIFGWLGFPKLGVAGAAWASLIGYALTITVALVMFFSGAFKVRLDWASVRRMNLTTMWQMMKIGLPPGVSSISFSLGRMIVTPMIAHFGAPVIAIYGAGNRVIELGILLVVGLELGMSPLIGHALGAKDKALAWLTAKKAVWLGVLVSIGFGALMAIFAGPLTRIFFAGTPYDELGLLFFQINAITLPFIGIFILLEGAFTGAGDTMPIMVIGLIHSWVFEIPLIWLFAYPLDYGPAGVWWGFVVSHVLSAALYLWWFTKRRWLDREV
jgi:putative MATE family efflux protein